MNRVIMHWTAGTYSPNAIDLKAYHYVIDGAGKVHNGMFPVSANAGALAPGRYAAHTLSLNTGSIGVSLAAMAGAVESPFTPGRYPITDDQVDSLVATVASLCRAYDIPVTRETVLTHAEVQPTLGIAQKQKWDIVWLPWMLKPGPPVAVGDVLRARISGRLNAAPVVVSPPVTPPGNIAPVQPFWVAFKAWLAKWKGPTS